MNRLVVNFEENFSIKLQALRWSISEQLQFVCLNTNVKSGLSRLSISIVKNFKSHAKEKNFKQSDCSYFIKLQTLNANKPLLKT